MAKRTYKVQVRLSHLDKLPEVTAGLREAGLAIRDEVPELGHYVGVADETAQARLEAVPGVLSARPVDDERDPDPKVFST